MLIYIYTYVYKNGDRETVCEREQDKEEARAHARHTAARCKTLQHIAAHCNTLHHTASHCNTQDRHQHAEPNYFSNTLQHTATHCSTHDRHHHTAPGYLSNKRYNPKGPRGKVNAHIHIHIHKRTYAHTRHSLL